MWLCSYRIVQNLEDKPKCNYIKFEVIDLEFSLSISNILLLRAHELSETYATITNTDKNTTMNARQLLLFNDNPYLVNKN